jgi:SAM-dependent methyltransferase
MSTEEGRGDEGYDVGFSDDDHYFHGSYLTEQRADDDAAELLGLLELDPGGSVLDAGCGDGRIAVRLASLGYRVVGVDLDADQLERARARAVASGVDIEWIHADLARLEGLAGFDGASLWFNTWGFASDAANTSVLRSVIGALRPGGVLAIDTLERDAVLEALADEDGPVIVERNGARQEDLASFDERSGRLVTHRTTWRGGHRRTRTLRQRLLSEPEWRALLESLGADVRSTTSRAGAPLGSDVELVVVAQRR